MMASIFEDNQFWDAIELLDQAHAGAPDKDAWIKGAMKLGVTETDAIAMYADAHEG